MHPAKISTDFSGEDVALMVAYVPLKSQYTPLRQWYLHTRIYITHAVGRMFSHDL